MAVSIRIPRYQVIMVLAILMVGFCYRAWAMTMEMDVTAAYVKEYPKEFSVKVERGKSGLLNFTVTRTLKEPKYFVAEFTLRHDGRVMAESYSPSYGQKYENKFYFSLAAEDIAESSFVLGESNFTYVGDQAVVEVGTIDYKVKLMDFVPKELLEKSEAK